LLDWKIGESKAQKSAGFVLITSDLFTAILFSLKGCDGLMMMMMMMATSKP